MAGEDKGGKVQALHPTLLNEEELSPYLDEFSFAFSDAEVTNIAISGPYGAGKSTVANSWEQLELKKARATKRDVQPWVHISLSAFVGENENAGFIREDEEDDEPQKKHRDIESELINQLIFKLKPRNAPKSRFTVTEDSLPFVDIFKTIFVAVTIGLTIILILGWENSSLSWTQDIPTVIMLIVWLLCIAAIIYRGFRSHSIARIFKRLKLFNAEVEVFDDKDDPAFNRYMDDIIYLLVGSKSNVVVFEDLDRFSDVSVFEKLRRVNELANARRMERTCGGICRIIKKFIKKYVKIIQINEPSSLRFIYLVKDSLFKNPKDRTKFFDLIIPVIPFVDPANSYDVLHRGLEGVNVHASEAFLYQLSLYVDDPRILMDICNESYHYKKALLGVREEPFYWDYDKLVAMVAYKVLFPEDYELLQVRGGYVFSLFQKQQKLAEQKRSKLTKRVGELEAEIKEIKFRTELNEEELKLLFSLLRSEMRYALYNNIYPNGNNFKSLQELISEIKSSSDVSNVEANAIAVLNQGNNEFTSRLKVISEKGSDSVSNIKREIDSLRQIALQTGRESLVDLLGSSDNIDDFFASDVDNEVTTDHLRQVAESKYFPMIRFFVIQGYIDENYQLYMSNQYDEVLSWEDRGFLTSLLGGYPTEPAQMIESPRSVLIRLKSIMLARPSARNHYLFSELLEHGPSEKVSKFMAGVAHDHDYAFVVNYVLSDQFKDKAYSILARDYERCLAETLSDPTIAEDTKRIFCKRVMSSKKSSKLMEQSADAVCHFASADPLFISDEGIDDISTFETSLQATGYIAEAIYFARADQQILSFIVSKGMLKPRADIVLGCVNSLFPEKAVELVTLNDVLASKDADETIKALRDCVLTDLDVYLASLIATARGVLADHDLAIRMMLNELPMSSDELVSSYVGMLENRVQKLSSIREVAYWTALMVNQKCVNTTENICRYYHKLGFDDALASFIEFSKVPDDLSLIAIEDCNVDPMKLLKDCLKCDEIGVDTLAGFAKAIDKPFENLKCPGCSSERMKVIIKMGLLSVTPENLMSMREDYPDLVFLFASQDLDSYVGLVLPENGSRPECTFIDDEALELFGMTDLKVPLLVKLVDGLSEEIPLSEKYPDSVNIELISKKKFDGDAVGFASLYELGGKALRDALVKELVANPDMAESIVLPDTLASSVMQRLAGDRDQAVSFLADRVSTGVHISRKSIARLAEVGGLNDYASIIRVAKRTVSLSLGNEDIGLIHALQEKKFCGRLEEGKSKDGRRILHAKGYSNKR